MLLDDLRYVTWLDLAAHCAVGIDDDTAVPMAAKAVRNLRHAVLVFGL